MKILLGRFSFYFELPGTRLTRGKKLAQRLLYEFDYSLACIGAELAGNEIFVALLFVRQLFQLSIIHNCERSDDFNEHFTLGKYSR